MTDWFDLTARGGKACHAVVGFMMWDARAKERFGALGFPNPDAWVVAWRLAALGDGPRMYTPRGYARKIDGDLAEGRG